jgi:hypothetical protein
MSTGTISIRPQGQQLLAVVPWESAEAIQAHLRDNGVPTTLVLDAATREARLEPFPDVDLHKFQFHLAEWAQQAGPSS